VFGITGQGESDDYFAILLWNEYIALSMKVGKGVPIPVLIFALVTQCPIWGLGCCTKNADLKMEQFLSRFTAALSDRRRTRNLQSIVGG